MGKANFRKAPVELSKFYLYSQQFNLQKFGPSEAQLFAVLEEKRVALGFPAVTSDVGGLLSFLVHLKRAKVVFEFGSGYGQSAFWFLANGSPIKRIYLTEKMKTLKKIYEEIDWPKAWRKKMQMHWGDAFECLAQIEEKIDVVLMDGQKRDYLRFLLELERKLKKDALVIIDNAFFKGSFLDPKLLATKKSVESLSQLHQYLAQTQLWTVTLLAEGDGLFLLQKKAD